MKAILFISTIGLVAASLCAQSLVVENLPIEREGNYWVRTTPEVTVSGSLQPRLQVSTSGKITLRGGDGDRITWKLKQRVSGPTEEFARRRLGGIEAAAYAVGNLTVLNVDAAASTRVRSELEVSVPKKLLAVFLQTQAGGIEAYDLEGDISVRAGSGDLQMDRIGGNVLQAQTGGGNIHLGKIVGTVQHCSTGAGWVLLDNLGRKAACTTAGGDMQVQEAGGPLDLSTEGGNIRVMRAASSVNGYSAAGLIDIGQAGGPVTADARGGSIRIASAHGLQAASTAGMVTVKAASGPMSVSTAMGNIWAELLAGAHLEDSSLVAGAGDITVLIPSNFPVSIMWPRTSQIRSDFPEIQPNSTALFRPPMVVQGALNGGGPVLRLNAGDGVIYLRRIK